MTIKITLAVVLCWLVVLTVLTLKSSTPPKELIEREVSRQLREREKELVNSYTDKLARIQKDMGVPVSKMPETIEDVLEAMSKIMLLPDEQIRE